MIRFPRLRFSLRTLVVGVLLVGSAAAFHRNFDAWSVAWTWELSEPSGVGVLFVGGSDDGRQVLVTHDDVTCVLCTRTGTLLRKIGLRSLPDLQWNCIQAEEARMPASAGPVLVRSGREFFSWTINGELVSRFGMQGRAYAIAEGDKHAVTIDEDLEPDLNDWHIFDDGRSLVTCESYGGSWACRAYDTGTGRMRETWAPPGFLHDHAAAGDDMVALITDYSRDGQRFTKVWKRKDIQAARRIHALSSEKYSTLLLSRSGHDIVSVESAGDHKLMRVWDIAQAKQVAQRDLRGELMEVKPLPDGRIMEYVRFDDPNSGVRIWNRDLSSAVQFAEPGFIPSDCRCSPDLSRIAGVGHNEIAIFDTHNGRKLFAIPYDEVLAFGGPAPLPKYDFLRSGDRLIMEWRDIVTCWHRHRPEYWWGVACLPEFWLTLLFAGALVWSIQRDRRVLRASREAEA